MSSQSPYGSLSPAGAPSYPASFQQQHLTDHRSASLPMMNTQTGMSSFSPMTTGYTQFPMTSSPSTQPAMANNPFLQQSFGSPGMYAGSLPQQQQQQPFNPYQQQPPAQFYQDQGQFNQTQNTQFTPSQSNPFGNNWSSPNPNGGFGGGQNWRS